MARALAAAGTAETAELLTRSRFPWLSPSFWGLLGRRVLGASPFVLNHGGQVDWVDILWSLFLSSVVSFLVFPFCLGGFLRYPPCFPG